MHNRTWAVHSKYSRLSCHVTRPELLWTTCVILMVISPVQGQAWTWVAVRRLLQASPGKCWWFHTCTSGPASLVSVVCDACHGPACPVCLCFRASPCTVVTTTELPIFLFVTSFFLSAHFYRLYLEEGGGSVFLDHNDLQIKPATPAVHCAKEIGMTLTYRSCKNLLHE